MSFEDFKKEKLWPILIETAHTLVMYQNHKAFTRETILSEKPDISPIQLAAQLHMPFGEALVIMFELAEERKASQ